VIIAIQPTTAPRIFKGLYFLNKRDRRHVSACSHAGAESSKAFAEMPARLVPT